MDGIQKSVVYIDQRAQEPREYTRGTPPRSKSAAEKVSPSEMVFKLSPSEEANENIHCLLRTFSRVFVHRDNDASMQFLKSIDYFTGSQNCTLVFIHTAPDADDAAKTPEEKCQDGGEQLLSQVTSLVKSGSLRSTLVPVALVPGRTLRRASRTWTESKRSTGALDILPSPLTTPLSTNYVEDLIKKARDDARKVKQDQYSNMTQDLVQKLLGGLCNQPEAKHNLAARTSDITSSRQEAIVEAFSKWSFPAHDFTDAELGYGVFRILRHALQQPGLEQWNLCDDDIMEYLSATQIAYNNAVIYHNFHHACDVLQAVFYFLVSIGAIPPLIATDSATRPSATGLGKLIRPVDALTLIIAAIGHDVGHPGVNNLFLVKVKAAVAQLYNDHSVLESYHCAASSRILRHYWPAAHSDIAMRKLMISSILATDMTLHSQYTTRLDDLRQKWSTSGSDMSKEDSNIIAAHRELICCLLIKSADICNVARTFDVAKTWAILVTDEFAHQGDLEKDAEIPSCLFGGPPARGDISDLAKRQMGFINAFALDLFMKMTEILPEMQFTVDHINSNKERWQQTLQEENEKQVGLPFDLPADGRRGSQVPPAQPQEVPRNDARTQEVPKSQPQAARPSMPLELPKGAPGTSVGDDEAIAPDEKPQAQHGSSSRPGSSGQSLNGSSYPRYTTYSGSAPGTSPFNQPSPRSLQDSAPRRRSPAGATQSPKLSHVTKEPRRSSLGNNNLAATSETQEAASRRSSGTYSYRDRPTLHQSILNSHVISASQLRVDGPSDTPLQANASSASLRPFSFSSGEDEITVQPWKGKGREISYEAVSANPAIIEDDGGLASAVRASSTAARKPWTHHSYSSCSEGEVTPQQRNFEAPPTEDGRVIQDGAMYQAGTEELGPTGSGRPPTSLTALEPRPGLPTSLRPEGRGLLQVVNPSLADVMRMGSSSTNATVIHDDPFLSPSFISDFPLDTRPISGDLSNVPRYGRGFNQYSSGHAMVPSASVLGEGESAPPLASWIRRPAIATLDGAQSSSARLAPPLPEPSRAPPVEETIYDDDSETIATAPQEESTVDDNDPHTAASSGAANSGNDDQDTAASRSSSDLSSGPPMALVNSDVYTGTPEFRHVFWGDPATVEEPVPVSPRTPDPFRPRLHHVVHHSQGSRFEERSPTESGSTSTHHSSLPPLQTSRFGTRQDQHDPITGVPNWLLQALPPSYPVSHRLEGGYRTSPTTPHTGESEEVPREEQRRGSEDIRYSSTRSSALFPHFRTSTPSGGNIGRASHTPSSATDSTPTSRRRDRIRNNMSKIVNSMRNRMSSSGG